MFSENLLCMLITWRFLLICLQGHVCFFSLIVTFIFWCSLPHQVHYCSMEDYVNISFFWASPCKYISVAWNQFIGHPFYAVPTNKEAKFLIVHGFHYKVHLWCWCLKSPCMHVEVRSETIVWCTHCHQSFFPIKTGWMTEYWSISLVPAVNLSQPPLNWCRKLLGF